MNRATPEQQESFKESIVSASLFSIGQKLQTIGPNGDVIDTKSLARVDVGLPEVHYQSGTAIFKSTEKEIHIETDFARGNNYRVVIQSPSEITVPPVANAQAGTLITFATKEGIHVIPAQAESLFFKSFVPVFRLLALPENAEKILDIRFVNTRGGEEQLDLIKGEKAERLVFTGGMSVRVKMKGQSEPVDLLVPRWRLQVAMIPHLLYLAGILDFLGLNRGGKIASEILQDFSKEMGEFYRKSAKDIDRRLKAKGAEAGVLLKTLANFAQRGGETLLNNTVSKTTGGVRLLEALANTARDFRNVGDWRKRLAPGTLMKQSAGVSLAAVESGVTGDADKTLEENLYQQKVRAAVENRTRMGKKTKRALGKLWGGLKNRFLKSFEGDTYRQLGIRLARTLKKPLVATVVMGGTVYAVAEKVTEASIRDAFLGVWVRLYVNAKEVPGLGGFIDHLGFVGKEIGSAQAEWAKVSLTEMLTKWAPVGIGMISFLFVAYYLVGLYTPKDLRGKNISRLRRVLTVGKRIMARLNYAVQAIVLEKVFRQKLVYPLDGMGINVFSPGAKGTGFHRPGASAEEIQAKAERINEGVNTRTQVGPFAEYMTALLVAHLEQNPNRRIDVGTLVTTLQLKSSLKKLEESGTTEKAALTLEMLQSEEARKMAREMAPWMANALVEYVQRVNPADQPLDQKAYEFFLAEFRQIIKTIHGIKDNKLSYRLKKCATATKRLFTEEVFPFLFLGSQWRRWSLINNMSVVSEKAAHLVKNTGPIDYLVSTSIGLLTYPLRHIDFFRFLTGGDIGEGTDPLRAQRAAIPAVQTVEQTKFQGSLVTVGAESTLRENAASDVALTPRMYDLFDPPPIRTLWSAKAREQYYKKIYAASEELRVLFPGDTAFVIPRHRKQTFGEAAREIRQRFEVAKYSKAWGNYIKSLTMDTTQAYLLIGAPAIALGFVGTVSALSAVPLSWPMIAAAFGVGALANLSIVLIKYTPEGYAGFWPPAHGMHSDMHNAVKENLETLKRATYDMARGLYSRDQSAVESGINALKDLFAKNGEPLPKQFKKHASKFSVQDIQDFALHGMRYPPGPTVENSLMAKGVISFTFLALGTTVLYYVVYRGALAAAEIFVNQGPGAAALALTNKATYALGVALGSYFILSHAIPKLSAKWQNYKKLRTEKKERRRERRVAKKERKKKSKAAMCVGSGG